MRRAVLSLFLLSAACGFAAEPSRDWAFKPLSKPAVPSVRDTQRVRNPIDAFLLAELEKRGLTYAPEAERVTLVRRVYFDLIGLPPSPKEVDEFVADKSSNAFEKLVDRLLESPRHGERQATWWLDLVRFAESDGFKSDDPRPNAWRYRDYVIRSFNTDKPYDRFVKEQLAGDELFPGDADALIATGYLRHYPYEYNAVNCEQRRQETLNDITDTTAAAFLGITLGCARCHDHKFDPIKQTDYYRIQAFFAAFWPVDAPLGSKEERERAEQKRREWEAQTAELRKKIEELEQPFRAPAQKKERSRFIREYSDILDIPFEKRTPLQKQIGALVEAQVYSRSADVSKSMKAPVKEQWQTMMKQMSEYDKQKPPTLPTAMTCTDVGSIAPPTHLLKRGDWQKPDAEVAPGYLSAIDDRIADLKSAGSTTGRRAALANWIAKPDNPLATRTIVNRIWQTHFGRGLAAIPNDLGAQGDKPTHPELLDWMANRLSKDGWSLKKLHRLIVTSSAYRQTAGWSEQAAKIDPENKLLWRMPRRRLDAESLRDSLLAVSGQLSLQEGGPSVYPELPAELKAAAKNWKPSATEAERNRRSVYIAVRRNLRYPLLAAFDAPDASETCGKRYATMTAPQALMLLNDVVVQEMAKRFATRLQKESANDVDKQIDLVYRLALARNPDPSERSSMKRFVEGATNREAAIVDLCHAVLNLNEFLFVD